MGKSTRRARSRRLDLGLVDAQIRMWELLIGVMIWYVPYALNVESNTDGRSRDVLVIQAQGYGGASTMQMISSRLGIGKGGSCDNDIFLIRHDDFTTTITEPTAFIGLGHN